MEDTSQDCDQKVPARRWLLGLLLRGIVLGAATAGILGACALVSQPARQFVAEQGSIELTGPGHGIMRLAFILIVCVAGSTAVALGSVSKYEKGGTRGALLAVWGACAIVLVAPLLVVCFLVAFFTSVFGCWVADVRLGVIHIVCAALLALCSGAGFLLYAKKGGDSSENRSLRGACMLGFLFIFVAGIIRAVLIGLHASPSAGVALAAANVVALAWAYWSHAIAYGDKTALEVDALE